MWKNIVTTEDLIVQETSKGQQKVRIEARSDREGWNVIKRYYKPNDTNFSYTEDYHRPSYDDVKETINHIKQEILSKKDIENIKEMRKYMDVQMSRIYMEGNVEKWSFSVYSRKKPMLDNVAEDGYVVIKHGQKQIEVDIMVKQRFHHYEYELLEMINEKLGLMSLDEEKELIHNFFYFFNSNSYSSKPKEEKIYSMIV